MNIDFLLIVGGAIALVIAFRVYGNFSRVTEDSCEHAIKQSFAPFAAELGLELVRIRQIRFKDDNPYMTLTCVPESKGGSPVQLYEIVSPHFALRIRAGTGPWTEREKTSLAVTLVPTDKRSAQWDVLEEEIGIYAVARYHGDQFESPGIFSRQDFERETKKAARLVERYGKPFLLGTTGDFPEIRLSVDSRKHEESLHLQKMLANLPQNVKPMWRREGESHADWQKRLQEEREASES